MKTPDPLNTPLIDADVIIFIFRGVLSEKDKYSWRNLISAWRILWVNFTYIEINDLFSIFSKIFGFSNCVIKCCTEFELTVLSGMQGEYISLGN